MINKIQSHPYSYTHTNPYPPPTPTQGYQRNMHMHTHKIHLLVLFKSAFAVGKNYFAMPIFLVVVSINSKKVSIWKWCSSWEESMIMLTAFNLICLVYRSSNGLCGKIWSRWQSWLSPSNKFLFLMDRFKVKKFLLKLQHTDSRQNHRHQNSSTASTGLSSSLA